MLFPSPSRVLSPSRLPPSCVLPLSPSTNPRTREWRRWLVEAGARACGQQAAGACGDWRPRGERRWPRRLKATPAIEGNGDWRCPILLLFSLVHPIVVVARPLAHLLLIAVDARLSLSCAYGACCCPDEWQSVYGRRCCWLQLGGHPELGFRPTRGLPTLQGEISTDPKQAAGHFWPDLRQVSEQHQSKSKFFVQFCAFGWWS